MMRAAPMTADYSDGQPHARQVLTAQPRPSSCRPSPCRKATKRTQLPAPLHPSALISVHLRPSAVPSPRPSSSLTPLASWRFHPAAKRTQPRRCVQRADEGVGTTDGQRHWHHLAGCWFLV